MKKFLPILVLSVLFAASLVPTTASIALAGNCSANCQSIVGAQCVCGTAVLQAAPAGTQVCGFSAVEKKTREFNSTADCLAAASVTGGASGSSEVAPIVVSNAQDLINLIEKIGNWVFTALLAIAAIFLIVAGLMWVTAGGNPEKANKARQMLINALIGVAIALLARGMVMVIRSVIGG